MTRPRPPAPPPIETTPAAPPPVASRVPARAPIMAGAEPSFPAAQRREAAGDTGEAYFELPRLIERLHRRYLDVVRGELAQIGIKDLNPVQAMVLLNIGDKDVTIQELIDRHAYLRSNASYNVKKLVELGYIEQSRAPNDRRAVLLHLTDKAREALNELRGEQARFAKTFAADPREPDRLERAYQTLRQLERAWEDYLRYERG